MNYLILLCLINLSFSQIMGEELNKVVPKTTFLEADIFSANNPDRALFYLSEKYRFIGTDPYEKSTPDFHLTDRTIIDTLNFKYITMVNSLVYMNELEPYHGKDGRSHMHYTVRVEILKGDSLIAFDQEEKKIGILSSVYKDNLFYKSRISFTFNLEPGDYTLRAQFRDDNSKMQNYKEYPIHVRKTKDSDILISDITFIDEHLNEEVFGQNNAFMNRDGFILLEFDTYKKSPEKTYSYTVEMSKKLTVSEVLQESIRKIFSAPSELFKSLFQDTLELDTIYQLYYNNLYDTENKFNRFQIRMPKSMFNKISFPLQYRKRRLIEVQIQPKLYVVREVEMDPDELEDDQLLADSMKNENFANSIITSKVSELQVIDHVENVVDDFTFTWDSIPQTRNEMNLMLTQMRTFIHSDTLAHYKEADLKDVQKFYAKYWTELSFSQHRLEGLSLAKSFIKKVNFANENFFDFIPITGKFAENMELVRDPVHKNGWNSDKGLIYLKYGLPTEMSGTNYIDNEGNVIRLRKQPYQRWVYTELNKEFFFIGNRIVKEK